MKNAKYEYSVFYDLYKGGIRTRYLYIEELKTNMPIGTINKQSLENINIELQYLYNLDIRFSLSNEKISQEQVTDKDSELTLEKKRHSFKFTDFVFDITEISKINKDDNGNINKEAAKFQFEIEIINRKLTGEEIYNKLLNTLKLLLSYINS